MLREKIEAYAERGSGSKKSIGEWLLGVGGNVKNHSMQQVAFRTYVSKATLVRFAKGLGFDGWPSFADAWSKECYFADKHNDVVDCNYPFSSSDSLHEISEALCSLMHESLNETIELLDPVQLARAVSILCKSRRVFVLGMSPNTDLAELFKRKMLTIGRWVHVMHSQGNYHYEVAMLSPEDCAIVVSYSGDNPSRYPTSFIDEIHNRRIPVIAITGRGNRYLREFSDATISMASQERLYSKVATFATEESLQYIFNLLFSGCFVEDYDENLAYKIHVSQKREGARRPSCGDAV